MAIDNEFVTVDAGQLPPPTLAFELAVCWDCDLLFRERKTDECGDLMREARRDIERFLQCLDKYKRLHALSATDTTSNVSCAALITEFLECHEHQEDPDLEPLEYDWIHRVHMAQYGAAAKRLLAVTNAGVKLEQQKVCVSIEEELRWMDARTLLLTYADTSVEQL